MKTMATPVSLTPNFTLSFIVLALGITALFILPLVPAILLVLFGIFLIYQTATLRIVFLETTFAVQRSGKTLVDFPYVDWFTWKILWPPLPILLFFKEVKSIHFIPMLFSPKELRENLERFIPQGGAK
jgi:hypothetical protein